MREPCCACGDTKLVQHGSADFPSVNLCYRCARDWFEWMIRAGVADGNPLIASFWYNPITVWIQSDYDSFASSPVNLKGFKLVPVKNSA